MSEVVPELPARDELEANPDEHLGEEVPPEFDDEDEDEQEGLW